MAHQIQSAVFSALEGAGWTGLGQAIPESIAKDPRRIAELCNAMFKVDKRACYFKNTDGSYSAAVGRDVLVRSDNNKMLSVVSDNRYHVENRQPVDIFEAFRDELAANNMTISHAAVLRGGADIAVCASLPAEFDITVGKNDLVKSYITASTGYNGHGTKCTKGGIRVVCANTLAAAIASAEAKDTIRTIRASTLLETDSIAQLISRVKGLVDDERNVYNGLLNTQMSSDDVARFFADVLEVNIQDMGKVGKNGKQLVSTKTQNILTALSNAYGNSPGAATATGTAWGALNAVTYYATHEKTVRDTSESGADAARVASNMNGDAARMKVRALQLAAAYSQKVAA